MLMKYKQPPEDMAKFDELFEQTLDDMMLKEELRPPMRNRTIEDKWLIVQNQMKMNIKSNFTILSTLELLKSVHHAILSDSSRDRLQTTRRARSTR